jgi:hypothetical protein
MAGRARRRTRSEESSWIYCTVFADKVKITAGCRSHWGQIVFASRPKGGVAIYVIAGDCFVASFDSVPYATLGIFDCAPLRMLLAMTGARAVSPRN